MQCAAPLYRLLLLFLHLLSYGNAWRLHMSAPPAGGPTSTSSTSTRRSFVLGNTAAAAAAASASGASPAFAAAATAAATAASSSRVIGRASGAISGGGLPLSVGLGTCLVRDGKSVVEQVSTAVAEGYRIFDTAQRYNNEAGVGRALRDAIGAGTLRREEVFLTTKVWCDNMGAEKTAPSVERSAARLRLDPLNSDAPAKIDLVLIHWPGNFVPFAGASKETLAANAALRKETWRALETLQAQGKVAQIGVSNYHERHFRELLSYAKVRPAVSQFEVHPYNARAPLIELCRREGVAVEAYSPLGGGGNANGVTAELLKDPVLTGIARRKKKTAAQVALRWHLQRGVTPIPKASSRKRIAENLAVFDFELSAAEMDAVSALDRGTFAIFDGDQLA